MARPRKSHALSDDRHLRLGYLGARCVICRRTVKAADHQFLTSKGAFQFNHIDPSQKAPDYENVIRRVISTPQLDELDKCNLLCSFCHGIWTNQRVTGNTQISSALPDGRIVKRRFSNHGLMKVTNGRPHFHLFADNPQRIETYAYCLGNSERVFRAGFELEKSLVNLMLATRGRGLLRVWDYKGPVFEAQRLDDSRLQMRFCTRFPLIKFEGRADEASRAHFWIRNGKAIIKDYGVRETGVVTAEAEYAAIERALGMGKDSA